WEDFSGENPSEAPNDLLFSSWMFASSPASSALEHPVYDIWPLRCEALELSGGDSVENNPEDVIEESAAS
ncbi:MAG: DUF2155 domain-containing protein, partial [bacterium]|nr:DUF2155 domain-containing protein [bacterium]